MGEFLKLVFFAHFFALSSSCIESIASAVDRNHCLSWTHQKKSVFSDFKMRKKQRLNCPGACALECQDVIDILVRDLFGWDINNQRARMKGRLGTVLAFGQPDEEQSRLLVHSHWIVCIKELGREVRQMLFSPDKKATRSKSSIQQLGEAIVALKLWT